MNKLLKHALLGTGFVLVIATIAFAQSYDPEFGSGNVGVAYMVQSDGSTMRVGGKTGTINDAGHAMAMQYGAELPAGSVLYRKGNKLYAVKDQMVGDQMMSARVKNYVN